MSIKGLTEDERATYFLGLAVRRQLKRAPPDPDTVSQIRAVFLWCEHWLTPKQADFITVTTGYLIRQELADELTSFEFASFANRGCGSD